MMSLDQALETLATRVRPLTSVELPLEQAVGHVVAETPYSDVDLPPAHVSAMDGYAARCSDLADGRRFEVAFEVVAGAVGGELPPGCVARIFTGAVLPQGADTVVPQEQAIVTGSGEVELDAGTEPSHVRVRGEVLRTGEPLARIGDIVTPQLVGLLASGGASRVRVVRRPIVAALVTGSEVVPHHAVPEPGQIRNSNGPMLSALMSQAGLGPLPVAVVSDDESALRGSIESAVREADVVMTSGGVSVGDYDFVPRVVRQLGGEVVIHRVAVKPGKPVLVAQLGGHWLVGLPGNPVSVLASWRMFARPLIRTLAGQSGEFREIPTSAVLQDEVENRSGRTHLRPAVLSEATVRILPWKGSHDIVTASRANAMARIEPGTSRAPGESIPCYRL
jgi:molybdopterin molybdotransferase